MKQEPCGLPVTLVNAKIGSIAEITYPCHNAEMIEPLRAARSHMAAARIITRWKKTTWMAVGKMP